MYVLLCSILLWLAQSNNKGFVYTSMHIHVQVNVVSFSVFPNKRYYTGQWRVEYVVCVLQIWPHHNMYVLLCNMLMTSNNEGVLYQEVLTRFCIHVQLYASKCSFSYSIKYEMLTGNSWPTIKVRYSLPWMCHRAPTYEYVFLFVSDIL